MMVRESDGCEHTHEGRKTLRLVGLGLIALTAIYAFQRPFREYPGIEYNNFPETAGLSRENRVRLSRA